MGLSISFILDVSLLLSQFLGNNAAVQDIYQLLLFFSCLFFLFYWCAEGYEDLTLLLLSEMRTLYLEKTSFQNITESLHYQVSSVACLDCLFLYQYLGLPSIFSNT